MKKKSIRQLKLEQRNFSRWDYNEYDEEGKSREELLEEKCNIINRELIFPIQAKPPKNPKFLNTEEILKLLEEISESWTCSGEECQAAIKQVGRVLAYLTGATDEKPESMAVAEPSELIYEYTSPLIFLGYKKPFDFEKDTEKYAQDCLDAFFGDHEGDDEFEDQVLNDDTDGIYDEAYESIRQQFAEGHNVERWQLEGNDDLIEAQGSVNPEDLDPENYNDVALLGFAIRCEILPDVWDFYSACKKFKKTIKANRKAGKPNKDFKELCRALYWGYDFKEYLERCKDKDINATIELGGGKWTPLEIAVYKGNAEAVKMLLDKGATLDTTSAYSFLRQSLGKDYKEDIIKLILESGVDINASEDRDGCTPLMITAFRGNADLVKFLLDNGADPNIKYKHPTYSDYVKENTKKYDGWTALDFAKDKKHTDVVEILEKVTK